MDPRNKTSSQKKCWGCWKLFQVSDKYRGKRPKCKTCRYTMARLRISEQPEEKETITNADPVLFEFLCRIVEASAISGQSGSWFDALFLVTIYHYVRKTGQNPQDLESLSEVAKAIMLDCNIAAFEDSDNGLTDSDSDSASDSSADSESESDSESKADSVSHNDQDNEEEINKMVRLLHEIYPQIGLHPTILDEYPLQVRISKNNVLYSPYSKLVELQAAIHSKEPNNKLEEFVTSAKDFVKKIKIPFWKHLSLLYQIIEAVYSKKEICSSEASQLYTSICDINLLTESQEESPVSWTFQILRDLVISGRDRERSKEVKIQKVEETKFLVPKVKGQEETCTPQVVDRVLDEVRFAETVRATEAEIAPPVEQTVQKASQSTEVQTLLLERAKANTRRTNLVRTERGVTPEILKEREQQLLGVGRVVQIGVEESSTTKQIALLCSPGDIKCEVIFDYDFAKLSPAAAQKLETQFLQTTAAHMNIPVNQLVITSSVAGSWKLNFTKVISKYGEQMEAGELYDKFTHGDYMSHIEKELRIICKKKPKAKITWMVNCPVCLDKFRGVEQGLLCTGIEPHWCCDACLAGHVKQKFIDMTPDIKCVMGGCDALYVNTHLVQKISNVTNNPDFFAEYTQASLIKYKTEHPYPQTVQCELCNYLTDIEDHATRTTWTCGEGVPRDWITAERPCNTKWCLECNPMRQTHTGPHLDCTKRTLYNRVLDCITEGYLLVCPQFKTGNCTYGGSLGKLTGCNSMTCETCNIHFCFVCGINIDQMGKGVHHFDSPDHPCPMYGDDEEISKARARKKVDEFMAENNMSKQEMLKVATQALQGIGWQ